jgi:DNA-binding XRE family transcriptional regulator
LLECATTGGGSPFSGNASSAIDAAYIGTLMSDFVIHRMTREPVVGRLVVSCSVGERVMQIDPINVAEMLVNALAKALESRRQNMQMSQEELARRAGLSRTYLSDIERGLRNISVLTLHKLAAAMQTQASTMLLEAERTVTETEGQHA